MNSKVCKVSKVSGEEGKKLKEIGEAQLKEVKRLPQHVLPYFKHVAATEGVGALWKGFLPKIARLGPGGGVVLVVYEMAYKTLTSL